MASRRRPWNGGDAPFSARRCSVRHPCAASLGDACDFARTDPGDRHMMHVMASIVVRPEHASAARALLADLAAQSRHEPGCVAYELFQRADQPHVFRTVEQWLGAADIDAHMK